MDDPVHDPDIEDALKLMYGVIIAQHPNSIAVLVRLLASVAFASNGYLLHLLCILDIHCPLFLFFKIMSFSID